MLNFDFMQIYGWHLTGAKRFHGYVNCTRFYEIYFGTLDHGMFYVNDFLKIDRWEKSMQNTL